MKKITIKNLIDFRRKNEQTKITFVNNLNREKKSGEASGGGDYWVSCLSAISNAFRYNNFDLLNEKIELLREKIKLSEIKRIKTQFQRNIDILNNFEDFDFQNIKPKSDLTFHKQPKIKSILTIKGFPIEAIPSHVFSFSENKSEEIGAVWFIAKLDGYKKNELAMFADILYRYLDKHYSKNYYVNPSYCIAIDVFKGQKISYKDVMKNKIPILIEETIDEIKKYRNFKRN